MAFQAADAQGSQCGSNQESTSISCTMLAMIDKELLDILVCPECKTSIIPKGESLKCPTCRRLFPIKDDIPIMLLDEATIDSE
jgi:uncharacterized protein YbaR (Trm112 family)